MNINQYAVYQLKEIAELAAYRSRSYQYLMEQHFHMTVQNYQQAYFTKLFTSDTPEMIRKRLEEHKHFMGVSLERQGLLRLLPEADEISCTQEAWPLV